MQLSCSRCGTLLSQEANFCSHCGQAVKRRKSSTQVFAIANQKGRVGKTTTAINLGACLAHAGYETLIVDMAPGTEATTGLGIDAHKVENSIYELLVSDDVIASEVIMSEVRPHLSLLPSKVDLYAAEMELQFLDQREYRLRRTLETVKHDYDFVLIDCPSWLGMLTINCLTAADGVILPLMCDYFALEGMQQLLNTIRLVRDRLNSKISLFGVLLTMNDPRTKFSSEVVLEISEHFPKEMFQTIVAVNVHLAEASIYGLTILEHGPRSPGALAYKQLAEEVVARVGRMEV